jgi:5-methylcytosine-specific restriction endonuclease McrA
LRYGNPLKVIRKPGGGWKQPEEVKKKIRENAKRGDKNSSWKGGVRIYRKMALKKYDNKCSICGVKEPIIVHHKDGNRKNNKIENLEILCLNCHWKKHQDLKTQKESFSISGY